MSRRLLLALAPCLGAAGFALWTFAPSYPAFAAGFVLWGLQGALQSGAFEALVFEELDRRGAAARYATVAGRASALGTVASAVAIGLASPVLAAGGFGAVGVVSVAACLCAALAGAALPEHRAATVNDSDEEAGMLRTAAIGVSLVRRDARLRLAVVLVPAVWVVWGALDEYAPLLAAEHGARDEAIPLLLLVVYAGVAMGGLLGAVATRRSPRARAAILIGAATCLAAGAVLPLPWGFALLGIAFCALQAIAIAVETDLQHAISGPARATVTSLAGLLTEVASIAVYATYGAATGVLPHAALFVVCAAAYLPVAALIALRRRRS